MATIFDLQRATLAARARNGDPTIGTRVQSGRVQIVRVTYPERLRGDSVVAPVSAFMAADAAVHALDRL